MITITITTDSAAWFEKPGADELKNVLKQVQRLALDTPMGPSGFVLPLHDTNGNTTGRLVVTPS